MAAVSTRVILPLISRALSRIEELALTEDMGVLTFVLLMLHIFCGLKAEDNRWAYALSNEV